MLARVDGTTRDLRLPLADGEHVQFLTTRDTADPDALFVLRHSTAHLLAEAVVRLHPGVKIAIGPPIADGFYYDFEFPEPISEADLEAIEDEIRREIAEGREWTREELSREEAIARFEAEAQPYKVELARDAEGAISLYTQGDVHGSLPRPAPAERRSDQGREADEPRGRLLARRREEHPAHADLRHGVLLAGRPRRPPRAARAGAGARPSPARAPARPLPPVDDHSPGSPFWHPKGMVLWNALEDLRRRENARRGYVEVKTPLLYDIQTYDHVGALRQLPREHVLHPAARGRGADLALKPMNCPGHMLLFGSQLRSLPRSPDPLRGVVDAPSRRARRDAARADLR